MIAAREELSSIQSRCANFTRDPILLEYEKLCLLNFNDLSAAEETWCRQKSRIRWLSLGDNNKRFFHKNVASHRMRNKILSICDEDGNRLEDPKAVEGEIIRFYKQMLGSKFVQKRPSSERLCFVHTVPSSFHDALIAPITPAEIKVALFAINGDQSPGPDCYNSSFFQKNWSVVGQEVTAAILHFFQTGVIERC